MKLKPAGTDPRRFVVFGSDHDQVGNRATGDRPAASLSDGRLAAEAALILLSPFTPMLFMGEEWGTRRPFQFFTDHTESELAQAVTQGRRDEFASFGWGADEVPDPQDRSTVEASVLDWAFDSAVELAPGVAVTSGSPAVGVRCLI